MCRVRSPERRALSDMLPSDETGLAGEISGAALDADTANPALGCVAHLRWDFVYQRPQHLMSRFARERRVFFVEEPIFDAPSARMEASEVLPNLWVCTPHLPENLQGDVI